MKTRAKAGKARYPPAAPSTLACLIVMAMSQGVIHVSSTCLDHSSSVAPSSTPFSWTRDLPE